MERLSQTAAGKFSTALDNAKQALAVVGEQLSLASDCGAGQGDFNYPSQSFVKTNQSTLLIIELAIAQ